MIVAFPGHTHLIFVGEVKCYLGKKKRVRAQNLIWYVSHQWAVMFLASLRICADSQ